MHRLLSYALLGLDNSILVFGFRMAGQVAVFLEGA